MRRSFALAATVLLAVTAGCSTSEDPAQTLRDATAALAEGNYTSTTTLPDQSSTAVVHLPSHSASFVSHEEGQDPETVLTIGGYQYYEIDESPLGRRTGKHWQRIETGRLEASHRRYDLDGPELTGAVALLAGVHSTERDGAAVSGTLDGTKVTSMISLFGRQAPPTTNGVEPFQAVPYVATLDDKGRLSTLTLTMPPFGLTPAGPWTLSITGYGESQPIAAPDPTGVNDADDDYYAQLNR